MPKLIDYWRGLIADVRTAESADPEHLRAIGDLWYPVLRMRVLSAVHGGAEKVLGPSDMPAEHAETVAREVWNDFVVAAHKRAVPQAWPEYAQVIERLIPWLAMQLHCRESDVDETAAGLSVIDLEDLTTEASSVLTDRKASSREQQSVKGAVRAYLWRDREWPDLGTWAPFTLFSLASRHFEHGKYLGPTLCSSENEILDLVNLAPYGRNWAQDIVRQRAQTRTVDSYLTVLNAILDGTELPHNSGLVARRLSLAQWLADPEMRIRRMIDVQGMVDCEKAISRRFSGTARTAPLLALRVANGTAEWPVVFSAEDRKALLERVVESLEACAIRTELIVQTAQGGRKRGIDWAKAMVSARSPRSERKNDLGLLATVASRSAVPPRLHASERNRSWRRMYRTLANAARPDAGPMWETAHAAEGTR